MEDTALKKLVLELCENPTTATKAVVYIYRIFIEKTVSYITIHN